MTDQNAAATGTTRVKRGMADMLKEQGIECARRTVAKYREALRIAPTNLRKTL